MLRLASTFQVVLDKGHYQALTAGIVATGKNS